MVTVALFVVPACAPQQRHSTESVLQRAEGEAAALLKRVKVYDETRLMEYLGAVVGRVSGVAGVRVSAG